MKLVQKIQLKIVIFTAVKNRCMLHGRVFVMSYVAVLSCKKFYQHACLDPFIHLFSILIIVLIYF